MKSTNPAEANSNFENFEVARLVANSSQNFEIVLLADHEEADAVILLTKIHLLDKP